MCNIKSGIILKDRIYLSKTDSHSDLLEELKIEDIEKNAKTLFVRAELKPLNFDIFSGVDSWQFVVDQDILPDWFVKGHEEIRFRKAVKEWVNDHILIGKENFELCNGYFYIKDCKNVIMKNDAFVDLCLNSTVSEMYGKSTVSEMYDNSVRKIYENYKWIIYISEETKSNKHNNSKGGK